MGEMMGNKYLSYGIIVAVVILVFYFVFSGGDNSPTLVQSEEFSELIGDGAFVLQVHTPYYGEIEGTDLVVEDWENIENYLDELPSEKEAIAVYCKSGRMSGIVAEKLAGLGYEKIYELDGGMNSWESDGRNLAVEER